MSTKFLSAACVLLPAGNFREEVMAISRRGNPKLWGIPGGKEDPDENNIQAAIREIREELGIYVGCYNLIPIFCGPCYGADGKDFWVTTYLADHTFGKMDMAVEEGLFVKPMSMVELCHPEKSPFSDYNRSVMMAWRKYEL